MINYRKDLRNKEYSEIVDTIYDDFKIDDDFFRFSEDDLLDYETMENINRAYNIVSKAVEDNKLIMIHADCDTDGVTAGTIMHKYLNNYTHNVRIMINDGKAHGLEPVEAVDCDLLIVVDSINDEKIYNRFDVPIVVLDHHIHGRVPDHVTLVSAMDSENPNLSGAGVVWKFCKYYDLMQFENYADDLVDLAATGIVADMMDMSIKENRYICNQGFNNLKNPALKKIVGGYEFNAKSVAFSIAPLINACNRLNKNQLALDLLNEDDPKKIKTILTDIKDIKAEQDSVLDSVDESKIKIYDKFIVLFSDVTNLSGVIANKLSAKFKKPALVVHDDGNGMITGSQRGYGVKDFSKLLEMTGLCECKGHENSSGIFVQTEKFDDFIDELYEIMDSVEIEEVSDADYLISTDQIYSLINFSKMMNRISGTGFRGITFVVETDQYEYKTMTDGKHMKLEVAEGVNLIKWKETPDISGKIRCCGTLDSSFFGRQKNYNLIIDKIEVIE